MTTRAFVSTAGLPRVPRFTARQAVEACRLRLGKTGCMHYDDSLGMCLHNAACVYGYRSSGVHDAALQWRLIPAKYKHTGIAAMRTAPAGALVFWTGGRLGYGHIGVADGFGNFFGTDLPTSNEFGRADVDRPKARWGLTPVGWTLPFFEFGIAGTHKAPTTGVASAPQPKPTPNLDAIIASAKKANVLERQVIEAAVKAKKASGPAGDKTLDLIIKTAQTHIAQNKMQVARAGKLK